ncbi:MAG: DUF1592 domain-containing protein [Myxococcota bacterium]
MRFRNASPVLFFGLLAACADASAPSVPDLPSTEVLDAPLRRLTSAQYQNVVRNVLGANIVLPARLEPDIRSSGLIAIGAARTTLSEWGLERYENAALDLAEQALAPDARSRLVSCRPQGNVDDDCARDFITTVGRRLWRRPPTDIETALWVSVARDAATSLGDFYGGLQFALAGLLQSPSFLYRFERSSEDDVDPWVLASRLSFLLWNSGPDDQLLDAAASGALLTREGLHGQVNRMIDAPQARVGVRAFFTDLFELDRLDELEKDPQLFVHFDAELGPAARTQTLLDIERLIFELGGDYRDLFVGSETFVDRRLAAIYGVPAPAREGFGLAEIPASSGRRGLLGQVSFLALHAHAVATSAVLRGRFVRQALLCEIIPPPPVNLNTALPEPTPESPTLRDRNKVHLESPNCSGCHSLMDPIGLGLENFDGIGRWRSLDNGAEIDASGELDGQAFEDAWTLAEQVRTHPMLPRCLVSNLYRYALGREATAEAIPLIDGLTARFEASGYRFTSLLVDLATSRGFRGREVNP